MHFSGTNWRRWGLVVVFLVVSLSLPTDSGGGAGTTAASPMLQPAGDKIVNLPLAVSSRTLRRVNAPHFDGDIQVDQAAIFWFGRVTPTENFADVRVGYNNTELYVHVAIFDRRLWYDKTPSAADLTVWDSTTLYLSLAGPSGTAPATGSYRFDAQLNDWETPRSNWQAAYRGNGTGWGTTSIPFTTVRGYRWESSNVGGLDNDQNNRGWTMTYHIPFSSLGLTGAPALGTTWGLALAVHDRDDSNGTPIADKVWPESLTTSQPATWGALNFGVPVYVSTVAPAGSVTIRQGLNGALVPDASVGGYTICGNGTDFWSQWGNTNEGFYNPDRSDFNIGNGSDVGDWPCFSKYYVTFPLGAIPAGKVIYSATLTLHQFGTSGDLNDPNPDNRPKPTPIQVMTVGEDWTDTALTWNNAPLALENISTAWVDPVDCFSGIGWPCYPRVWNVSRAVAQAVQAGQPLRLALYSADTRYHSGRYFVTSNTGDWNAQGRPTLQVTWGNP